MVSHVGPSPTPVVGNPRNGVIYAVATGKIVTLVWGTIGPLLQGGEAFLAVDDVAVLATLAPGMPIPASAPTG